MDYMNSKGWSNRRKLAELNSYGNADEDRLAIRRERQRLYDEAAESNRQAAEAQAASLAAEMCACTACGGTGRLPVPQAMRVVKALHNFGFHDHVVTKAEIAALASIAKGAPLPPGVGPISFSYGSVSPASGATSLPDPAPARPEAVEIAETPKPARKAKAAAEDQFTNDGFLIEV